MDFDYLLKRWDAPTRFLKVPGAPLDNNTERALKMIQQFTMIAEIGAIVGRNLRFNQVVLSKILSRA